VATKILEPEQLSERVNVLRYFLEVGQRCYELHNFNTVTAIMAALESTPVHRMRKTWDAFARKHRHHMAYVGAFNPCRERGRPRARAHRKPLSFWAGGVAVAHAADLLGELLSARGNFANYRKHLHSVSPPVRRRWSVCRVHATAQVLNARGRPWPAASARLGGAVPGRVPDGPHVH